MYYSEDRGECPWERWPEIDYMTYGGNSRTHTQRCMIREGIGVDRIGKESNTAEFESAYSVNIRKIKHIHIAQ